MLETDDLGAVDPFASPLKFDVEINPKYNPILATLPVEYRRTLYAALF